MNDAANMADYLDRAKSLAEQVPDEVANFWLPILRT
jgi:hypothetical protein